jgi:hypothetical protein
MAEFFPNPAIRTMRRRRKILGGLGWLFFAYAVLILVISCVGPDQETPEAVAARMGESTPDDIAAQLEGV